MAHDTISLPTVREQFSVVTEKLEEIRSKFSEINENFTNGIQNEWNTPTAFMFINQFDMRINDYIGQFNEVYQEALNKFVDGINELLYLQNIPSMEYLQYNKIGYCSRKWHAEEENFNVPKDIKSFAQTNLESKINSIITNIGEVQTAVSTAQASGLNGSYCSAIVSAMRSLKTSAEDVLKDYNSTTVESAAEHDSYLGVLRHGPDGTGPVMETQ